MDDVPEPITCLLFSLHSWEFQGRESHGNGWSTACGRTFTQELLAYGWLLFFTNGFPAGPKDAPVSRTAEESMGHGNMSAGPWIVGTSSQLDLPCNGVLGG